MKKTQGQVPDAKTLGQRLRRYRETQDVDVLALARQTDVLRQTIHVLENGTWKNYRVMLDHFDKLAQALRIPLRHLLEPDDAVAELRYQEWRAEYVLREERRLLLVERTHLNKALQQNLQAERAILTTQTALRRKQLPRPHAASQMPVAVELTLPELPAAD